MIIEFLIHFTILIVLWVSSVIFFKNVVRLERFEAIMLAGGISFFVCTLLTNVLTMLILYNLS